MAVSEFLKYGIESGLFLVQSEHVLVQGHVSSGLFLVQTGQVMDQARDLFS